jgi:hypothetical protein
LAKVNQLVDLLGVTYPQPFVRGQGAEAWLFFQVPNTWAYDPHDLPTFRVRLSDRDLVWANGETWWAYPPLTWQAGDIWIQRVRFNVPADMPPQSIQPELVVFNRQQIWPIILEGEQVARLAVGLPAVAITGQPVAAIPAATPMATYGDTLALLSASLPAQGMPGVNLWVKTTWQALRDPDQDYAEQLQLMGTAGQPVSDVSGGLWQETYPTSRWRAGERVTSSDTLTVPAALPADTYTVRLRLVEAEGRPVGQGDWVTVGTVKIAGRPHNFSPPSVAVPRPATFGTVAQLAGYSLDSGQVQGGRGVKLTLIWQALQPSARPL